MALSRCLMYSRRRLLEKRGQSIRRTRIKFNKYNDKLPSRNNRIDRHVLRWSESVSNKKRLLPYACKVLWPITGVETLAEIVYTQVEWERLSTRKFRYVLFVEKKKKIGRYFSTRQIIFDGGGIDVMDAIFEILLLLLWRACEKYRIGCYVSR